MVGKDSTHAVSPASGCPECLGLGFPVARTVEDIQGPGADVGLIWRPFTDVGLIWRPFTSRGRLLHVMLVGCYLCATARLMHLAWPLVT